MENAMHAPNQQGSAIFQAVVAQQIAEFESARLLQRLRARSITLEQYHAILTTLFHQTQQGPYTFAKAAVHCSWEHSLAKEYLLRHAVEEHTHWRWVLDDLANTGYVGPDPRQMRAHVTCEAYIGVMSRVAESTPVARLASAAVLEGIGAAFGGRYGRALLETLHLGPEHAKFFTSHGETDRLHIEELGTVIDACSLSEQEWEHMTHVAQITGRLYRAMYDHDAFA
jgi:hypothetical protein